jgi:DNA-directed RNA polymerase specialized sigma24 family protein
MNWSEYLASRPWLRAYAVRLAARCRPGLAREDAMALADLGMVLAASRFDPSKGYAFSTYARRWVAGEVLRVGAEEARWSQRVSLTGEDLAQKQKAPLDARLVVREILAEATPPQRHVLFQHGLLGHSLAEASRQVGRHRAWGHRAWKSLQAMVARHA